MQKKYADLKTRLVLADGARTISEEESGELRKILK